MGMPPPVSTVHCCVRYRVNVGYQGSSDRGEGMFVLRPA